jgi:hypothetical protein
MTETNGRVVKVANISKMTVLSCKIPFQINFELQTTIAIIFGLNSQWNGVQRPKCRWQLTKTGSACVATVRNLVMTFMHLLYETTKQNCNEHI